ncbi:MAG: MotA/TolQ/ExbB proton channel family protein [bacterium]|nr:MotA/TolQ/ExbB proton channel family protein [bacterium]
MLSGNNLVSVLMGSPTMIVLLLCSVVVVTFALERWWFFTRTNASTRDFKTTMQRYLSRNQVGEFYKVCKHGNSSLTRVVGSALENIRQPREEVEQLIDIEIEREQIHMEKNMVVLGTLANIAPLIGLLGTVIGIIRAFKDIAVTGSGGSSVIAMGVSEALLTTAAGIIVAVIATVFYNAFTRRIRVRLTEVEEMVCHFWKYIGSGSPTE